MSFAKKANACPIIFSKDIFMVNFDIKVYFNMCGTILSFNRVSNMFLVGSVCHLIA
jgi:hypothetical protein